MFRFKGIWAYSRKRYPSVHHALWGVWLVPQTLQLYPSAAQFQFSPFSTLGKSYRLCIVDCKIWHDPVVFQKSTLRGIDNRSFLVLLWLVTLYFNPGPVCIIASLWSYFDRWWHRQDIGSFQIMAPLQSYFVTQEHFLMKRFHLRKLCLGVKELAETTVSWDPISASIHFHPKTGFVRLHDILIVLFKGPAPFYLFHVVHPDRIAQQGRFRVELFMITFSIFVIILNSMITP